MYLYAEPARWPQNALAGHRREVDEFAKAIDGGAVRFAAVRWSDWVAEWTRADNTEVRQHAERLSEFFELGGPRG